jgi:hypothetical protein
MSRGESVYHTDYSIPITRNGYLEDTYFTLSYSPVHDDGRIAGVLVTVFETTDKVRAERSRAQAEVERARLLREVDGQRSRLAEIFQRSPSFIAVLRGPQHVFELANERYD